MTTTTTTRARAADSQELPPLTSADRAALSLGTQLILWGERHRVRRAVRAARDEQARVARTESHAESATRGAFERRTWAGPTW